MVSKRSKLLFAYLCSMLGLCLLSILVNVLPSTLSDNNLDMLYTLVSQIICMGIIPFCIALYAKKEKGEPLSAVPPKMFRDYRYFGKLSAKSALLLIPMVISFYFVTQLIARLGMLILLVLRFEYPMTAGTIYTGPADLFRMIALTALLPAIFEEFTHRGLLLDALSDKGNELSCILISGLMFALMHTNIMQFFYAFTGGCIFAYLVIRSKSIIPAMVLHFFNNTFSCISEYGGQHRASVFGFLAEANDFFAQNYITSLLYIVILVGNAALFVFLVIRFVKACPKCEEEQTAKLFRIDLPINMQSRGKSTLADNVMLITTGVLCGAVTVFSYIWGVFR